MSNNKMNIHESLVYIQNNLNAPKNLFNKFGGYKYRNLEGITDALKPLLKETGCTFVISDEIVPVGERVYVKATACLTSSDNNFITADGWAREAENKKGMDEAQITGSASSYARKYAANGLFCIDDTKDPDTTNTHGKSEKTEPKPAKVKTETTEEKPKLTQERFEKMKTALEKAPDKYTSDVKKTLSKVTATEEQMETLKGMMA